MSKNKQNKSPVTKGVCKVPMVMQLEALECGAASLAMVLAYYDKWIPLEQVRLDCGVSRDGSNAKNIMKAARFYGLSVSAYRCEPETLRDEAKFPCIIHWNFNHFVVLNGFKGGNAYINDPARGVCKLTMEEFDKCFTGVCMMFEPSESFEPSGKKKSVFEFAKKRLKGTGTAIAFTVITAAISSLVGMINPGFSRVFLDHIITNKNPDWFVPFFVLLAVFNIIQLVMTLMNSIYSLKINGKMSAVGNASYMWKILRMPIEFFTQRMAGDIQGRKSSNASIANTLVSTVAPLVLQFVMMVFYFVVMLRFSWFLTLVGLASLGIEALVSNIVSKKRVNIMRVSMRDSAMLSSTTVSGIEMIETIKSSGAENGFFSKWAGYQANVNTQNVKNMKFDQYLGIIPSFVSEIANNAVLIIGVYLTMQGEFTVGMIMAFQGYLASFIAPAQTFISANSTIQEMRAEMERVDDVMEYPSDDTFADEPLDDDKEYDKLSGNIEIKNLVFGYSKLAEPLINGFNLSVKRGMSVAIVGGSGCGKSTLSKLISGLYKPWSGEILFDGKTMSEIDKNIFSGSLAVVDQDIILFEDTISNNIKMWDDSIEDFEVILAARDAQLHDDIMKRDGGYQYKLNEDGSDFSGGQRQRLEIARVLAQDPTIIILDEATSALDAKTEYDVVNAIKNRGITCIVIAHRLSTIRSCDEILLMNSGEVIARGTHDELMDSCEKYRELVTSE